MRSRTLVSICLTGMVFASFTGVSVANENPPVEKAKIEIVSQPKNLFPELRLYPLLPSTAVEHAPRLSFRDPKDEAFGADLQFSRSSDALLVAVFVHDVTRSEGKAGSEMWQADSIQIAIETNVDNALAVCFSETCYEFGFALHGNGQVVSYAWQAGRQEKFDWPGVKMSGRFEKDGYRLQLAIPWASLALDAARLPPQVGINVLVNDGDHQKGRRFAEWTPGIGNFKGSKEFARLIVLPEDSVCLFALILDKKAFSINEVMTGQYVEYALRDLPARTVRLSAEKENRELLEWASIPLPNGEANSIRQVRFWLPSKLLKEEGVQHLVVKEPAAKGNFKTLASTDYVYQNVESQIRPLLAGLKARLEAVRASIKAHPAAGEDRYVKLGLSVAERFIERAQRGDLNSLQKPEWTLLQLNEVTQVLDQTQQDIIRTLAEGPAKVPFPTGGPVEIRDGLFWTETTDGRKSPAFFAGYGAFASVARDLPKFQSLGATLVQQERGPSTLNSDGTINPDGRQIVEILQRAAASNIKVDFLLSPHYFPDWAIKQAPDLVPVAGVPSTFFYNIDHPKAKQVIEQWLRAIVPLVKDSPALFSFCLSNEPTYGNSGRDPYSRPAWIAYLKRKHGNIETLNKLYGTRYTKFDDVVVPAVKVPDPLNEKRAYYDWMRFDQQHFADWHRWMKGVIKELAPGVPTHSKIMSNVFQNRTYTLLEGTDPELFCDVTDIAGFDTGQWWPRTSWPNTSVGYAYHWRLQERFNDLMFSFRGQPLANSENHLIMDACPPEPVPPAFTYSALWQGVLHHLTATAIWVWEEPIQGMEPLYGSVYLRPANIYTLGRAMLDSHRLADELATINRDKAKVAMLYSMPSLFWGRDGEEYTRLQDAVYTAFNFMGMPVTFISERQLATGQFSEPNADIKCIIIAESHVQDATVSGLLKFMDRGGHVIKVGADCLKWDEYQRPRQIPAVLQAAKQVELTSDDQKMMTALRPLVARLNLNSVNLCEESSDKPAFGVEYRVVADKDGFLAPMVNFLKSSQTVSLKLSGKAVDLITGESVDLNKIVLVSMQPRLLRIHAASGK